MANPGNIALFLKVVETGGFSAAARALGIRKATVSRGVAQLESELDVRLLHRTTRKVTLTALGATFHEEAERGFAHLQSAEEFVRAARAEPEGRLRVSAPIYLGTHRLMDWIGSFLAQHPKVSIELRLTDRHVDLVAERIDVALRTGRLPDSSLVARRLGAVERIFVASPEYLRSRYAPTTLADLDRHDLILLGGTLEPRSIALLASGGAVDCTLRPRMVVDNAEAALRAARSDVGIALLPLGVAADDLLWGRLVRVLGDCRQDGGAFHVVFPSNRHMPAAQRAFIDHVVTESEVMLARHAKAAAMEAGTTIG